ncbi:hypothetical protein L202_03729 [Cryptococcus amylolentus CBS 6039]|uniref:RRM domain-containing protein n=1 Tax=Cryptococcus amylolentus CBS 6039 TaxID=1295533 RepID=A0A1E3HUL6_9TREE|nr:hypothetical protein L202_03729 [Cryptococcus amylolentus CBS 6039]ODN79835.1 hypothetical protein L202_03729 [Cryptococcus amylolentus CBS 6039]
MSQSGSYENAPPDLAAPVPARDPYDSRAASPPRRSSVSEDRYASRPPPARYDYDEPPRDGAADRYPPQDAPAGRPTGGGYDRPYGGSGAAAPFRPPEAPKVEANNVLGVFGLSIRTRERDLEDEFMRYGDVEKVVIVYDQRSDRSRGFGFITMRTVEDATRCIDKLNGLSLHGRNIRVDYSATQKPHHSTPGQYMGVKRGGYGGDSYQRDDRRGGGRYDDRRDYGRRDDYYSGSRDSYRDNRRDRDPYEGRSRRDEYDYPKDKYAGEKSYDYDDRRSARRSRYSASPPRNGGGGASRDYDAPAPRSSSGWDYDAPPPPRTSGGSRDYDASAPPPPEVPRY